MRAVCLVDTSVFLEVLRVPSKSKRHGEIRRELEEKIRSRECLFLPMATILETGNHIAQNGDGEQRRLCARRFVEQIQKALKRESPFLPLAFLDDLNFGSWIGEFPDYATQELTLGDMSIIKDWERERIKHSGRRVYIWSLDDDLSGYDTSPI